MNPDPLDTAEIAKTSVPAATVLGTAAEAKAGRGSIDVEKIHALSNTAGSDELDYDDTPTEDELQTLRRVSGKIPWVAFTIAFCELCERFSYYGSTILYTNFVQRPMPPGSTTGAGGLDGQAGALDRGLQASVSIGLFNQFFAYMMPLVG